MHILTATLWLRLRTTKHNIAYRHMPQERTSLVGVAALALRGPQVCLDLPHILCRLLRAHTTDCLRVITMDCDWPLAIACAGDFEQSV